MIFSVIMLIKNHSRKKSHDTDVSQRKKRKRTFESLPESVYCATSKRKIIVPGGAAGLQIRLGPPAVPGRFDSCDLPPIILSSCPTNSFNYIIYNKLFNGIIRIRSKGISLNLQNLCIVVCIILLYADFTYTHATYRYTNPTR